MVPFDGSINRRYMVQSMPKYHRLCYEIGNSLYLSKILIRLSSRPGQVALKSNFSGLVVPRKETIVGANKNHYRRNETEPQFEIWQNWNRKKEGE